MFDRIERQSSERESQRSSSLIEFKVRTEPAPSRRLVTPSQRLASTCPTSLTSVFLPFCILHFPFSYPLSQLLFSILLHFIFFFPFSHSFSPSLFSHPLLPNISPSPQFRILRKKGTEMAGTGEYDNHHPKSGTYNCAGCDAPLYNANHKFKSGCGWPAFFDGEYQLHPEMNLASRDIFVGKLREGL